jgi:hypothetical protein
VTHQPNARQSAAIELLRLAFKLCRAAGVALIPEQDGTRTRILCRESVRWHDTDYDHLPSVGRARQSKCAD